ncbi:putative RNA-directed DNA polymerase, eukaryota, reverse transcriptase zinc-binding domain protein [Tanacetum coccineum]
MNILSLNITGVDETHKKGWVKNHWDIIEKDVIFFVKHFETSSHIPKGCNSSLITLIPKLDDPLVVGDFRPTSLIGCQYKIIAKVLANRLSKVLASVVGDVQMAFIKGRQIIDGPLIIDEIITWAKKCKKRMMFLKVDFEKAFDSLSWSFLLCIMEQVGFSSKWRKWIHSFLNSTFDSVLINGSSTKEFKLEKGLRQGDPLSPFLFILAVEALNVTLIEATNNNFFNGIKVEKDKIQISHLQFADDALILGDWSLSNAKNLSRILTCFHLASGLKVNFNKSKLFEIGVSNEELNVVASSIGCLASQFPSSYFGLPIGAKMSRCRNWDPLIERFQKRLSKWKANTLSIGGRVTLIKSVLGSLGVYYFSTFKAPKKVIHKLESIRRRFFWGGNNEVDKISWIAWDKVLLPRNKGGLGIDSLLASNQSLLAKWWWRFRNEDSSLWCKVIRSIHGPSGGVFNPNTHKKAIGTWSHIINLKSDLLKVDINLPMLFKRKIGDGQTTRFWHDNWLGGPNLQETFPCLYRLELNPNCLVCKRTISTPQNSNATAIFSHPRLTIATNFTSIANTPINQPPRSIPFLGICPSWALRRRIRSQAETTELNDLTNLLLNFNLTNNMDTWEFIPDASRRFTVNNMRKLISSSTTDTNNCHHTR